MHLGCFPSSIIHAFTSACAKLFHLQEGLGQTGVCALAIICLSHAITYMPEVADDLAKRAGIKQRCFVHAGVALSFTSERI